MKVTDEMYRERATALANMLRANEYRHRQATWGTVKEDNPCGTTACVAGWATLAKKGIVTIDLDGEMTYDPAALGPVAPKGSMYRVDYTAAEMAVPTLWRAKFGDIAEDQGRIWLGLSPSMARSLFRTTLNCTPREAAAVALLTRIGDGRVNRHDIGPSIEEMDKMVREDREDRQAAAEQSRV